MSSRFVECNDVSARKAPGRGLASLWQRLLFLCCAPLVLWTAALPARAERIENQVAVFSALDKVTARISKFEVELNKTATFGGLKVTPRACYSRPTTEEPKTTTFVEVDEVQLDGKEKRIFTGWLFAESPGIYGVEHPTFDVWLTECHKPTKATAQAPAENQQADAKKAKSGKAGDLPAEAGAPAASDTAGGGDDGATPQDLPRRRVRR